jgi:hypothetical protein
MKDNGEILSAINKESFDAFKPVNNYVFDKNNFCVTSLSKLPAIAALCSDGLASLKNSSSLGNPNNSSFVSDNNNKRVTGAPSTNSNPSNTENNNSKNDKSKNNNKKNLYDRGDSKATGQAIGSGLLSSFKYGIDTWRNFNQIKSFNQGMMNNAFIVRNAELNPPRLSFNPSPNIYPPAMYTGAPLGYMNPYSSTFNYNNNSFYYNTYDPTSGTTLSTDTSFGFSP